MSTHYFANQIYQFSYALPLYQRSGGTFILKSLKRVIQFKRYLRNGNADANAKTMFNTPPMVIRGVRTVWKLSGVVVSLSNANIHYPEKRNTTVFIGHGTGDKKYGPNVQLLEKYDYHFISGPKHLQKLRDVGVSISEERLIKIGNLRFDDYVNGDVWNKVVPEKYGCKPTWQVVEVGPIIAKTEIKVAKDSWISE